MNSNPAVQAMNLIRYIGDEVTKLGEPIRQLSCDPKIIDSPSKEFFIQIVEELYEQGIIRMLKPERLLGGGASLNYVTLSLRGWEQYEMEKRGQFEGNYGFIAMQFGDTVLDNFVRSVVKPAVESATGCNLVDIRDVARAGIIDNVMRVQIRDAKFVIADLTHDNHGAYWEAGYAEGLGKPVIYICEKKKFDTQKTHFDTNHCTTVLWSKDDDEGFRRELTATLRRSLDHSS